MRNNILLVLCSASTALAQSLISPANNSTVTNSAVVFQWTPAPAAGEAYEVRVFNTAAGVLELNLRIPQGVASEVYTFRSGQYRLEMKLCAPNCVPGPISNFTVANRTAVPPAPTNVACQVVNENNQNRVNCGWTAVPQGDFYFASIVQPNSGPGGGALTVAARQTGPNSVSFLVPDGRAFALIQSCTGDVCGPLSAPFEINPAFGNPKVPILSSPMHGSTVDSGSQAPAVFFAWNRIAGDPGDGLQYTYRLYVQDFSRNGTALDVVTRNNFYSAYLNPMTRYDAVVAALPFWNPFLTQPPDLTKVLGPPSGFIVRGKIPNAPQMVGPTSGAPANQFEEAAPSPSLDPLRLWPFWDNSTLTWSAVPDANGETSNRLYQWFVRGDGGSATGTTASTSAAIRTRAVTNFPQGFWRWHYQSIVRVCLNGNSCTPDSDAGWGPWSGSNGAEGGGGFFSLTKTVQLDLR